MWIQDEPLFKLVLELEKLNCMFIFSKSGLILNPDLKVCFKVKPREFDSDFFQYDYFVDCISSWNLDPESLSELKKKIIKILENNSFEVSWSGDPGRVIFFKE